MQRSTKILLGIIGGVLAAVVAFGIFNVAYAAQTGHPWMMSWSSSPGNRVTCGMMGSSCPTSSNGMMGNGSSGMMGNGSSGMMGGYNATPVAINQVHMTNQDTFSPPIITVKVGTTVTWTNTDSDPHNVTFMPTMIQSGNIASSATFHDTFTQAGTYTYACTYHPGMFGQVIVTHS
jgi:plastocyanin